MLRPVLLAFALMLVAPFGLLAAEQVAVEQAAAAVQVRDDALESNVLFILPRVAGPIHVERPDGQDLTVRPGLGAHVVKGTAVTGFQVSAHVLYRGDWHFYERATYLTGAGPQDVSLRVLDRKASCRLQPCLLSEVVAFEVPEGVLRAAAEAGEPWQVRFRSRRRGNVDVAIPAAEIAGLLQRVDAYPKPAAGR